MDMITSGAGKDAKFVTHCAGHNADQLRLDLSSSARSPTTCPLPGDLITCGTSAGIGVMKEPVNTVTVAIDGIGELTKEFRQ
jgi:hypothetical protein